MKKKLLQYGITVAVGALIAYWVMDAQGLFVMSIKSPEAMSILCDAFFVSGILIASVGALVWVSCTGFFDAIGYAFKTAAHIFWPGARTKRHTFYDYKTEKDEKRGSTPYFILIVGAGYILVALVLLLLWSRA